MKQSNTSPFLITTSTAEAETLITRVESRFVEKGLKAHKNSSFSSLISSIRNLLIDFSHLEHEEWKEMHHRASNGLRLLRAIDAAIDDPEAKEAINRTIRNRLDFTTNTSSQGKDALWELELYHRFNRGKVPIRFEEPDLIVSLDEPLNDYAIACKKIYSLKNSEKRLKDGLKQIKKCGTRGIIAFNLDDLVQKKSMFGYSCQESMRTEVDKIFNQFAKENHSFINSERAKKSGCDGVLLSIRAHTFSPEAHLQYKLAHYSIILATSAESTYINAFKDCLDRLFE